MKTNGWRVLFAVIVVTTTLGSGAWAAQEKKPTEGSLAERVKALEESPLFKFFQQAEISGFVATTYNFNVNDPDSRTNRIRVFDGQANQFTFNNAELSLMKETTTESPLGFGLVLNVGDDAEVITSAGFANDEFELQQGFVIYRAPLGSGIDLKLGKWATLIGAEVIESVDNFNISRSFLFGFAIPFTHTGLLASYSPTDTVGLSAGVVNGWDNVDDNNDAKSLIGQVNVSPTETLSLALNGIWGAEQDNDTSAKRYVLDAVITWTPLPQWTVVLNGDLGSEEEVIGTQDADWYGVAAVVNYDVTEKWGIALRGEYFRDEKGVRTETNVGTDLYEVTGTLHYKIADHLLARLEYRYDFAAGNDLVFDGDQIDLSEDDQGTIAVELAYLF